MSQTLFVKFRGRGFWAFDVVSGVFLKHLVDAATSQLAPGEEPWLSEAVNHWRFNAVIGDCGLFLDDGWSDRQIRTFTDLAEAACNQLSTRSEIPADEIEAWQLLDDHPLYTRGMPAVTTASAIRLGRAIVELVNGTLAEPPPGTWWFFSTDDAPRTRRKREP